MPAVHHQWTRDEVERLVDEGEGRLTPRYELVDGELLVTPAPNDRHQRIVLALCLAIRPYVQLHRLGEVRLGPGEARLEPKNRFEPDLFVVSATNGRMPRAGEPVTPLLLAAEVLSPASARHDRFTKRRYFQRYGVPDYWVIDGNAEAFEIWRPGDERARVVDDTLLWQPSASAPPLALDIRALFTDVADEP